MEEETRTETCQQSNAPAVDAFCICGNCVNWTGDATKGKNSDGALLWGICAPFSNLGAIEWCASGCPAFKKKGGRPRKNGKGNQTIAPRETPPASTQAPPAMPQNAPETMPPAPPIPAPIPAPPAPPAMPQVKDSGRKPIIPEGVKVKMTKQFRQTVDDIKAYLQAGKAVNLVGPAGAGKNISALVACQELGRECVTFSCSGDARTATLLGRVTALPDGTFAWQDGLVIECVRYGRVLILDEHNMLDGDITASLHQLLTDRQITLASNSEIIKAQAGFTIIGTMNPLGYEGVKPLNPAYDSRFRTIEFSYDSEIDDFYLHQINAPKPVRDALKALMGKLRTGAENGEVSLPFGHRTLAMIAEDSKTMPLSKCLAYAFINKLEPSQRQPISTMVNDFVIVCQQYQEKPGA